MHEGQLRRKRSKVLRRMKIFFLRRERRAEETNEKILWEKEILIHREKRKTQKEKTFFFFKTCTMLIPILTTKNSSARNTFLHPMHLLFQMIDIYRLKGLCWNCLSDQILSGTYIKIFWLQGFCESLPASTHALVQILIMTSLIAKGCLLAAKLIFFILQKAVDPPPLVLYI